MEPEPEPKLVGTGNVKNSYCSVVTVYINNAVHNVIYLFIGSEGDNTTRKFLIQIGISY